MFKNWKKHEKLWQIFLMVLLSVVVVVALVFAFFNFQKFLTFVKGLINAIMPFIYGFIIAYLCNPLYKRLFRHVFKFIDLKKPHPKVRKGLSIFFSYVIFFATITLLLFAIIPQVYKNIISIKPDVIYNNFMSFITSTLDKVSEIIPAIKPDDIMKYLNNLFSFDGELLTSVFNFLKNNVTNIITSVISQVFSIIVGIILSVYFLAYKEKIVAKSKRILCAFFKKSSYEKIIDFARFSDKTFGRYLIGTLLDSLLVGIVVFLILAIFKFPYAMLIGVIVGITNIIPFFGPFLGAIPSAILILIDPQGGLVKALLFVVIILIVQQIDGNIIAPHIHGTSTGLSPIAVILAVTVCSYLFGFIGMVIGVPLWAVIMYLITGRVEGRLKKKKLPTNIDCYRAKDIYSDEGFMKAKCAVEAQDMIEHNESVEKAVAESKITGDELKKVEERIVDELVSSAAEKTVAKAEAESLEATRELKVVKNPVDSTEAIEPKKSASIEVKTEEKKPEKKKNVFVLTPNIDKK